MVEKVLGVFVVGHFAVEHLAVSNYTVPQHMDHSLSGSGPSVLLCHRGVGDSVTVSGERFPPGGPGSIPHRVEYLVQL